MNIYNIQRIKRGSHSVRFIDRYFFPVKNKSFLLKGFMYGPGLRYDYGNSDNYDWNKYAGIQLDNYKPHGRTILIAFRYNQNLNAYEWTFYYHHIIKGLGNYKKVGHVPGLVDESNTVYTPVGSVPDFKAVFVNNQKLGVSLTYNGDHISDEVVLTPFGRTHTRGNIYWGGNMTAPEDIEARKKYTKL